MASEFKRIQPDEYFRQHLESGLRLDGRPSLLCLRPVSVSVGTIGTSDGSAIVKQGDTTVVCGVRLALAQPKPEEPDRGFIVPNVELPAMCHSQFKPGPPSEQAQAATQFIKEILTNSQILDPKTLCLKEGSLCWVVYIDLVCLNYDGNLIDCSVKALVTALRNVGVPEVTLKEEEEEGDGGDGEGEDAAAVIETTQSMTELVRGVDSSKRSPLQLGRQPVSCSVALFEDKLLLDPTREEELRAQSTLTIVLDADESRSVCHFRKPGGEPVSRERLQECVQLAKKQIKEIRKVLDKAEPIKNKV